MRYTEMLAWAEGQTTMYLVANGEMRPISFYEYSLLPLGELPEGSRMTPDYRLAYIISEHQKRQRTTIS